MTKRSNNKKTGLSPRDRHILQLAATGIATVETVHHRFMADRSIHATRSALRRLVEKGVLAAEPLDARRIYYRLTNLGARAIGASPKSCRTLKKQGKAHRYAVTTFFQGDSGVQRAEFNPLDYPEQFSVAGHRLPRGPFFLERAGEKSRLGFVLVDQDAHPRRIARKTVAVLKRFLHHGWFDAYIGQGAFLVAILTFSEDRKRTFDRHVGTAVRSRLGQALSRVCADAAHGNPIAIEVHVIPGLDSILTHGSQQKGKP